ncbi:hypothetical protein VTO42DRAFT_4479 [Malbranchea cinnamomea]
MARGANQRRVSETLLWKVAVRLVRIPSRSAGHSHSPHPLIASSSPPPLLRRVRCNGGVSKNGCLVSHSACPFWTSPLRLSRPVLRTLNPQPPAPTHTPPPPPPPPPPHHPPLQLPSPWPNSYGVLTYFFLNFFYRYERLSFAIYSLPLEARLLMTLPQL